MANSVNILLLSSSRVGEHGVLDHALEAIDDALADVRELVFVPYALADWASYTAMVSDSLSRLGIAVRGLHTFAEPIRVMADAGAVFVGGGNTFRLLSALERAGVLPVLRERAGRDLAYLAASAGTNLACPTIRTTNDMPIIEPASFAALGLVPFQINPHFVSGNPFPGHHGETREERIAQFHEVADDPVVGLPESCWLHVRRGEQTTRTVVHGSVPAVLFRRGEPAQPIPPGTALVAPTATGNIEVTTPVDSPISHP